MRRKKGAGSIYQRGETFYFRTQSGGKTKYIRLKARKAEDAEEECKKYVAIVQAEELDDLEHFVRKAKKGIELVKEGMTVEEAWEKFEKSPARPKCGVKQLAAHKSYYLDFCKGCGVGVFEQIDRERAESYFGALEVGASAYNKRLKTMRLIYKIIFRERKNPFSDIRQKKEKGKNKKNFADEELYTVFDSVDFGYPLSIPYRDEYKILLRVLAYAGMSLKDAVLLDFADISGDTIKTKRHKSGGKITLPLCEELKAVLPPLQASGHVMPNLAAGYPSSPSTACRNVGRIIAWALEREHKTYVERGMRHFRVPAVNKDYGSHSFRHTFISWCFNAGVPLDQVKEVVGQNNIAVTRIYAHMSEETKAAIIKAIPKRNQKEASAADEIKKLLSGKKLSEREKKILELLDKK